MTTPSAPTPLLAPLLAATLAVLAPAARAQDFAAASAEYEASLRLKSLYRRTLGLEAFAKTRDPRAFKALAARYQKPEEPALHVRYLLASVCGQTLREQGAPECLAVLGKLADKQEKPIDLWLHYALDGAQAKVDPGPLYALARNKKEKVHARAAALLALASARDVALLAALPDLLADASVPRKPQEAALWVEACARALAAFRGGERAALKPAAEAVVAQLDGKKTSEHTRMVLGRLLQHALSTARPELDGAGWRAVLEGQEPPPERGDGTQTRARFFSVTGTGRRVAYVLDLSDSMLEPLGAAEVEKLKKAMPEEAASGAFAKNRFEATKLVLARSLRELAPSMAFAIVAFGNEAELVTPGLLQATPQNLKKAEQALAAIEVGPPGEDRPHGTLKGWTNLYGGLRLAFKLTDKGAHAADDEYVADECLEQGCDTIFLLSDGEPTWSDFEGWDPALPDDVVGDGEGGGSSAAAEGEEIQYYGPHFLERFLLADLERLNLVRHVQIHAIGIGEADPELLSQVARIGLGTSLSFGAGGE